jgi:hypothetical protein
MVNGVVAPGTATGLVLLENSVTNVVIPANPTASNAVTGGGSYNFTTAFLPAGSYSVIAHYGGDGMFAPHDSAPIAVTVTKQNSQVLVNFVSFTGASGTTPVLSTSAQSVPYGSSYILRVDVTNSTGTPCENASTGVVSFVCPTGTIQLLSNGSPLNDFPNAQNANSTNVAKLNDRGFAEDQPIQLAASSTPYAITATYTADANSSYNSNASSNTLSVTITRAATTIAVTPSPTSIVSGGNVTLTANVTTTSNGAVPTGTVQFLNGSTALGAAVTCSAVSVTASAGASCVATLTTTLSALGIPDTTSPWRPKLPPGMFWLLGCCAALYGLFLWRMQAAGRRGYAYAGLVVFALAAAGIAGCGGGGGSSKTPQTKTVTITAKFAGDTNYTASSGTTIVTIQ